MGHAVTAGVVVSSDSPSCAFVLVTSKLMNQKVIVARMMKENGFRIIESSMAVVVDLESRYHQTDHTNKKMLDFCNPPLGEKTSQSGTC